MPFCFNNRTATDPLFAREPEVLDGFRLIVGIAVVVGQLDCHFGSILAICLFFSYSDSLMKLNLASWKQIVQDFLVKRMLKAKSAGDRAVGPGDRALRADELLSARQVGAASLNLVVRRLQCRCDRRS